MPFQAFGGFLVCFGFFLFSFSEWLYWALTQGVLSPCSLLEVMCGAGVVCGPQFLCCGLCMEEPQTRTVHCGNNCFTCLLLHSQELGEENTIGYL